MTSAGEDGGARVGDAEAAIGVAVKSELRAGEIAHEAGDDLRDFFGTCAAVGIADHDAAHVLAHALLGQAGGSGRGCAGRNRGRRDCRFRSRPQLASMACSRSTRTSRPCDCRQSMVSHVMSRFSSGVVSSERSTSSRRDLTTMTAAGMRRWWRRMNCTSGQSSTLVPRPRERPKRASFIWPVSTEVERAGEIADELVGSGKTDLGIVHAELGHALQEAARRWAQRSRGQAAAGRRAGWCQRARLEGAWSRLSGSSIGACLRMSWGNRAGESPKYHHIAERVDLLRA